jgi:hypothetical protein
MMQLPDARWFTAAAARPYVIPDNVKSLVATLPVSCVKPKASPGAQNRPASKAGGQGAETERPRDIRKWKSVGHKLRFSYPFDQFCVVWQKNLYQPCV